MGVEPIRDELGEVARRRVHAVLELVGDEAAPPRDFDLLLDLSGLAMSRPVDRSPRRRGALGVIVAVAVVVIVGTALVALRDHQPPVHLGASPGVDVGSVPVSGPAPAPSSVGTDEETDVVAGEVLTGGPWIVTVVDGTEWAGEHRPYFVLDRDGSVRGSDGCNTYGSSGSWAIHDGVLVLPDQMESTTAACPGAETISPFGASLAIDDAPPIVTATMVDGSVFTAVRLDQSNAATPEDVVGSWTDGSNVFTFGSNGVLTFSRETLCDGSYTLSPDARLDVSFGACGTDSVSLVSPIFRNAVAYVVDGALFIAGDAGVAELLPARVEAEPDSVPASDPLSVLLAEIGADVAGAPALARTLGDAQFCGFENTGFDGMWSPERNDTGRRCLLDAHLAALPAVLVRISPTDEGDPIVGVVRTMRDGSVVMFTDESQDAYGPNTRGWLTGECSRLTTRFPFAPQAPPPTWFQCAEGFALTTPTDDVAPSWFTARDTLPLCGYDVRIEDNDQAHRTCFHDAVATSTAAEFAVVEHGDEGERVARWFRVTAAGAFEAFERWLPHDGPGSPVSQRWIRYECAAFEFTSAPGFEPDNLPSLETCTPVADDQG